MQLWTHHPSTFRIDDPDLRIDCTKGQYWQHQEPGFRYRNVLAELQSRIQTDQFLWCCTVRGLFERMTEEHDLVEWELDVPRSAILAFYSIPIWENLVSSRVDDWENLIPDIPIGEEEPSQDLGALVAIPLKSHWVKCLGSLPVKYPNSHGKP